MEDTPIQNENEPQFLSGPLIERPSNPPANTIWYDTDTGDRTRFTDKGKWEDC